MNSQKTTHILLTIIAVGIFFMIFLFMKERYFSAPAYQNVDWGQPVVLEQEEIANPVVTSIPKPARVTNTPGTPAVTSSVFVKGQTYDLHFTVNDTVDILWTYCYENNANWVFSDHEDADTLCEDEESYLYKKPIDKKNFLVNTKQMVTEEMLTALNKKYGIEIFGTYDDPDEIELMIPKSSNYDSYAMSKIYFDTGYFDWVTPGSKVIHGSNN